MKNTFYILQIPFFVLTTFIFSCEQKNTNYKDPDNLTFYSSIEDGTIINLYDAFGKDKKGLIKDFGFSALIKYNGKLILFDAGTNANVFKKNVETLGINLAEVDFAIGSHAHGDHINGFDYLLKVNPNVKIYLPNDLFIGAKINFDIEGKEVQVKDSLPIEMRYFGGQKQDLNILLNQSGRFWNANCEFIQENTKIAEGINLIYTRSPFLGYGSKYPSLEEINSFGEVEENGGNNELKFAGLPELSLSLSTDDGEILIVGCSHSSVQNIVKETKYITESEISLLYGGYHMLPYDRAELENVASQLKGDLGVKRLAPAHCTGHLAFKLLSDKYDKDYLFAGLGERTKM